MKKTNLRTILMSFKINKIYISVATLAICMSLSIGASGQGNGKGKPTPTPTPVPTPTPSPDPSKCGSDMTNLSLVVENIGGSIVSDNNTAYTTGKSKGDQITAMFQLANCSQDFTLNLNSSSRYMDVTFPGDPKSYHAKFYNFDRVASVPRTDAANFLTSDFCTRGAGTANGFVLPLNPDGTRQDNYAGCGTDDFGNNYVRRNVGIGLDDGTNASYSLRFQNSPYDGGTNAGGTSYIKVYHSAASTWVLEPEAPAIGVKLLSLAPQGTYNMPFRFTLTKLP